VTWTIQYLDARLPVANVAARVLIHVLGIYGDRVQLITEKRHPLSVCGNGLREKNMTNVLKSPNNSNRRTCWNLARADAKWKQGRVQPVRLTGAVSVLFGSQVSWRGHYCKRDEHTSQRFCDKTTGRQNGLMSQTLFSELNKIMVIKVTFVGFRRGISPSWIRPRVEGTKWPPVPLTQLHKSS